MVDKTIAQADKTTTPRAHFFFPVNSGWNHLTHPICRMSCRGKENISTATPRSWGSVLSCVYTGWSVLTPRCHTGRNTGVNIDQPVYTPF